MRMRYEQLPVSVSEIIEQDFGSLAKPSGTGLTNAIAFWRGASGQSYVHSIFDIADCPALPPANYVLVTYDDLGRRSRVQFGVISHKNKFENRRRIRRLADRIGATEIHIHYLGDSRSERARIAFDLEHATARPQPYLGRYAH